MPAFFGAVLDIFVCTTLSLAPKYYFLQLAWPVLHVRSFAPRHNSTTKEELDEMVKVTGFPSMDALIDATVPAAIRRKDGMKLGKYDEGMSESEFLEYFK